MTRRALSWAISDRLGGVVLGDHQQAARVAVEAMDDPRPRDAGDAAVLAAAGAGEQRVDERVAVVMPGRRMDDEARRLVDDEQVVVLVDDARAGCPAPGARSSGDGLRHVQPELRARRRRSCWPCSGDPSAVRRPSVMSFWTWLRDRPVASATYRSTRPGRRPGPDVRTPATPAAPASARSASGPGRSSPSAAGAAGSRGALGAGAHGRRRAARQERDEQQEDRAG